MIVVSGAASVERPPEWASLSMNLVGEGKTQVDALKAMNALHEQLKAELPQLKDVTSAGVEGNEVSVQVVRGVACASRDDENNSKVVLSQGACAPVGYVATLQVRARVMPATCVGALAAYASQIGAREVSIGASGVADNEALQREATRQALANARTQAEAIATASGRKLGPIIRIQDGDADLADRLGRYSDEKFSAKLQVRAPAAAAAVVAAPVDLTPKPVSAYARFTVVYSLQ
jgi:uncharacterized protein YggE